MKLEDVLFYMLAVILGGCFPVVSIHPLYSEEDLIFEEKLVGTWVKETDDGNEIWDFKHLREGSKEYELTLTDTEGAKGLFVANLAKLEDTLFLDVFLAEMPGVSDPNCSEGFYSTLLLVPAHTFIKVERIDPELKMLLTNGDDFEKLLETEPNAVKHEKVDDRILLTASTEELQKFVIKYADDERVFGNEIILRCKEAAEPNEPAAEEPNSVEAVGADPNAG